MPFRKAEPVIVGLRPPKENFRAFAVLVAATSAACAERPLRLPPAVVPSYVDSSNELTVRAAAPIADVSATLPQTVDAPVDDPSIEQAIGKPRVALTDRLHACGVVEKPKVAHCSPVALPVNCVALRRSGCADEAVSACESLQEADAAGSVGEVTMHAFSCMMQLRSCDPCSVARCVGVGLAHRCARRETR